MPGPSGSGPAGNGRRTAYLRIVYLERYLWTVFAPCPDSASFVSVLNVAVIGQLRSEEKQGQCLARHSLGDK